MQTQKNINKQFLRLFVPAAALFGLIVGYFYFSEVEKERTVLEANEDLNLNLGKQVIEKDLEAAIADLRVLSQHREFDKIDITPNPEALERLAREFLVFAQNKRHYDQIRFLDETGKEFIRINFGSGHPYIVPEDQLQDKSKRYYFKDAIRLKEGEIRISPLDLNLEHGKVEMPVKPVIRLATPVLYGQEKKRGVVVLNYLGSNLIWNFKEAAAGATDNAMLLDADGFWMYGPRTELEWGSQLGHGLTFKKQFPEAWKQITNANAGHFYNGAGLFTFDTVYPLRLGWKSSTGATVADERNRSEAKGKEYYWKVVDHVPSRDLDASATAVAMRLLLIFAPLFGLMVAGVWWLAHAQLRRVDMEEALTRRVRQQAAVAELGQRVLSGVRVASLMDIIVEYIAQVVEVEYCKVLELLPGGEALLMRAGTGWRQGLVGRASVGAGMDSQAGYTLASKDPVIVQDLREETRFTGPQLLHDHGVVSGMSVVVHGVDRPFGVLGAHTSKRRTFTKDDVHFLQAVANILSEVIGRESAQAQMRLQTSALTAAADGIVITDRDGNIQWVNPAYTRLTGYELDDALGKNPRILKSGKQDQAFYKKLWDTILSGRTWYGEICNKRKDGSLYLEEESITPVLDERGRISHFVAIKRDISERRRAEKERAQMQKQLRQAQKMEAVGQLTGGIAHDFNNILAAVLGYTELALERCAEDGNGNGKLIQYLQRIDHAGKQAQHLIAQMLAFSRGGAVKPEPMPPQPLLKESLKMLGSTLPSSIELRTSIEDNIPQVMMDPVHLHQMVMNLCINARDAMMGHGHIDIQLHTLRDLQVVCDSCHTPARGDFVELAVSDTGSGIDPEVLTRVFDPFFTTKEVGRGSGMGLAMVHGIVHELGGHIRVKTAPGKGSIFRLLFPVHTGEVKVMESRREKTISPSVQGNGSHILVVDDEESVAGFLGDLFMSRGYQVTVQTDSRQALTGFEKTPQAFDLVMTDQTMPKLTGAELAQAILAVRPELPVILCTGYSEHIDEERARAFGIRGFLNKPLDICVLMGLVRELLESQVTSRESVVSGQRAVSSEQGRDYSE